MNHSEEMKQVNGRVTRSQPRKRKWREIEMLKERYALMKELQHIDESLSYSLDELEF